MAWELMGNGATSPKANFFGTTDNQPLIIKTNNVEAVRIVSGGSVGIGTPDPSQRLSVVGSISVDEGSINNGTEGQDKTGPGLYFGSATTGEFIGSNRHPTGPNPYGIDIYSSFSKRLSITNGGNIGIGTDNPQAALDVRGGIKGGSLVVSDANGTAYQDNWIGMADNIEGSTKWLHIGGITDGGVRRLTLSADRVYVYGCLGIGTTNPGAKLDVNGDIRVSGDVLLPGADCAEEFDITHAQAVEPGTVMVIAEGGALRACELAYDKRVAGVVSGAGTYRTGILLDKQSPGGNRSPIALVGKVYCKVDAQYGAIDVGDLLTSSASRGYAMKASDTDRAPGTVIGKALHSLPEGQGLIPIMVALQ